MRLRKFRNTQKGHQQIHFKIAVPENCVRMDFRLWRSSLNLFQGPLPSSEIIDFVRVIPSDFDNEARRSIAGHILRNLETCQHPKARQGESSGFLFFNRPRRARSKKKYPEKLEIS